MGHPDVASDDGMVANGDAPEDRGIGVDGDVVFDDWVARHIEDVALLVILETLGTEGDTLIERDVGTNDTGLANDDTRTMVDGEVFAYLSSWMNVDTRLGVSQLCDDTRDDGHLQLMQLMGDAIVGHRVDHGVAEDNLAIVRCSRIVVEHGLHISIEHSLDLRQCIDKLKG